MPRRGARRQRGAARARNESLASGGACKKYSARAHIRQCSNAATPQPQAWACSSPPGKRCTMWARPCVGHAQHHEVWKTPVQRPVRCSQQLVLRVLRRGGGVPGDVVPQDPWPRVLRYQGAPPPHGKLANATPPLPCGCATPCAPHAGCCLAAMGACESLMLLRRCRRLKSGK